MGYNVKYNNDYSVRLNCVTFKFFHLLVTCFIIIEIMDNILLVCMPKFYENLWYYLVIVIKTKTEMKS